MASVPCGCGGAWVKGAQALVLEGGPTDEWDVRCEACGARALFRFEASAFFGYKEKVQDWVRDLLPDLDDRVRGRVARKIGPAFGARFHSVVDGLATDGDLPTLLYLRWRIERALADARQRAGAEEQ